MCVDDVECYVEKKPATIEEGPRENSTRGKDLRVSFGIDLIDHVLQDGDRKRDGHEGLEDGAVEAV